MELLNKCVIVRTQLAGTFFGLYKQYGPNCNELILEDVYRINLDMSPTIVTTNPIREMELHNVVDIYPAEIRYEYNCKSLISNNWFKSPYLMTEDEAEKNRSSVQVAIKLNQYALVSKL